MCGKETIQPTYHSVAPSHTLGPYIWRHYQVLKKLADKVKRERTETLLRHFGKGRHGKHMTAIRYSAVVQTSLGYSSRIDHYTIGGN